MRWIHFRKAPAVLRGFCLAVVVAMAASCQSVNRLREAQDSFNQAATADLRASFGAEISVTESNSIDGFTQWSQARAGYGSALLSLRRISGKDERVLRDEKLWGTKLALEALCHWKLGNYDKAIALAQAAQKTDQIYPRDRAVMMAMPGLVMIDHAYDLRARAAADSLDRAARINLVNKLEELTVKGSACAVEVIRQARSPAVIEGNHPVHVYLLQAQLSAYRNFRKAYELIDQTGVKTKHFAHTNAQAQLNDLARRVSGDSGQRLVNRWAEWDKLAPQTVSN